LFIVHQYLKMPATRGQKRQYDDIQDTTEPEPSTHSNKRPKLTNYVPLHPLLKKNGIDTSYGWGIASFYDKEELISSDKLIKYDVDTTLKIARYKGKEFPFKYIEYEDDYIISFDGIKINIKTKKDVNNLLEFGSPDRNNEEEPNTDEEEPETNEEEPDTDEEEPETDEEEPNTDEEEPDTDEEEPDTDEEEPDTDVEPSFLQQQNPIQYQQHMFNQQHIFNQHHMFQQQFSIQTMIRTEITTTLIPWMKEYIDLEFQKLKQ